MTSWGLVAPDHEPPTRRVRDQVREGVTATLCTLGASALVVVAFSVVTKLAG
jgi:hypothetical protein